MNQPSSTAFEYSGIENLEAMKHARKYNSFLINLIQQHIKGKKILDFGAGAGTFSVPLADNGFAVACVEPDLSLRESLEQSGFETFASIDDVADGSVDSIYSLNVLEHIEDDRKAIVELYQRLRTGGRIVLYVPAFAVLYSSMDKLVGHHRRYRRNDLVAKLETAGFRIEMASYIDSLGFFAALAYRWFGNDTGAINARAVRLYDRWLFPLSRIVDRLLSGSIGKNLLVVATRTRS